MPLTCGGTAALAHWITGIGWIESFLVGAALSPTDPVFAAAIVGNQQVPAPLRHLLNVESGLNDGLALPAVLLLLSHLGASNSTVHVVLSEVALGVGIGIAIPWITIRIERSRYLGVSSQYQPVLGLAILLLVYSVSSVLHAHEFLATFSAGIAVASMSQALSRRFRRLGEIISELMKLAALLVFGALLSPAFVSETSWRDALFALAALMLVRPIALVLALLGSNLPWPQRLVAAWFGPKGFASVVFGLIIFHSRLEHATHLAHLVALTVTASIIAHSSTDVPVARWLRQQISDPSNKI
jgi:NhaP-type Na+/H+ or K+/H+ antiporter